MRIHTSLIYSLRRLKIERVNTTINLLGLTIALAAVTCVIVLFLNELSYDDSVKNKDQVFRILNYNKTENNYWATTPYILGETLKHKYPEVIDIAHQYNVSDFEVKVNNEFVSESNLLCTESSFFELFSVTILQGSLLDFDDTKDKIILSNRLSRKYFGKENPIGKSFDIRCKGVVFPMKIVAVYEDIPDNSSVKPSFVVNIDFAFEHLVLNMISTGVKPSKDRIKTNWIGSFFTNYVLLSKGSKPEQLNGKLKLLGKQHSSPNSNLLFSAQAFTDIYFNSHHIIDNNSGDSGNLKILYIIAFVGLILLSIACVNYLNLASAQTLMQIKGFAIRKAYGAKQLDIAKIIILDYSLLCMIALPLAMLLAHYSLPFFSGLLGKTYSLSLNNQFALCLFMLSFVTFLTGFVSGSLVYLRFASSGISDMIKNNPINQHSKFNLRRIMLVFQVIVFIVLLSAMLVIKKQVQYALKKDIGFNKSGLIQLPIGDRDYETFKREVKQNPYVLNVSGAMWLPPSNNKMYISIPKLDKPSEQVSVIGLFVDYHFAETMGLEMILGVDFDEMKNKSGVLINQSAIKILGLKEIIGERTAFGEIVGVVKDFNMYSLKEKIPPMLIGINPQMVKHIALRLDTRNLSQAIESLKSIWEKQEGITPFNFVFTDDVLANMYKSEVRFSKIIGLLSIIAIFIASLGLLGLSLFMGRQKTKEIGIRKVNGAKTLEILHFLNSDFLKWVAIAFIIACPIAYYAMSTWLQNFAYKTDLSWWIFALAGFIAMAIALLTVSLQSWRAATRNPVESLRYE